MDATRSNAVACEDSDTKNSNSNDRYNGKDITPPGGALGAPLGIEEDMGEQQQVPQQNTQQPEMSYHGGLWSLIGEPGELSLDGKSVILPGIEDREIMNDDISSINSSIHHRSGRPTGVGAVDSMRILSSSYPHHYHNYGDDDEEDTMEQHHVVRVRVAEECAPIPTDIDASKGTTAPITEDDDSERSKGFGCLPSWIRRAPTWLKLMFALGVSLLVGASFLGAVGLSMSFSNGSPPPASSNSPPGSVLFDPPMSADEIPTPSPVAMATFDNTTETTEILTDTNVTKAEQSEVEEDEAILDESIMTSTPTLNETALEEHVLTFYATAGQMSSDTLVQNVESLDVNGIAFMIHMGDWNDATTNGCDKGIYEDTLDAFGMSPVPVYFTIGDGEYNDCPDPLKALESYIKNLAGYELKFWPTTSWKVYTQGKQQGLEENFIFEYTATKTIVCGINLGSGTNIDPYVLDTQQDANLQWIDVNYEFYMNTMDVFVLLAYDGPPGGRSITNNVEFYESLLHNIQTKYDQMYFVIIYNNVNGPSVQPGYDGLSNLSTLTVGGSRWPPMRIQINPQEDPPAKIILD